MSVQLKLPSIVDNIYEIWLKILTELQSIFLLIIRLFWGYQFLLTGRGKFNNFEKTVGFFTSLGIPFPEINALMAAGTEFLGGLCLILGLGSRLMTVPLVFTMIIAYSTAHTEELSAIFSDPDKFLAAAPFLFMFASLIVLVFGAGKYSLDNFISRSTKK